MMTIKELREQIALLDAPDSAIIRINGEYVHDCKVAVSYPLEERAKESGIRELSYSKRPLVVDIAANGREIEKLPVDVIR